MGEMDGEVLFHFSNGQLSVQQHYKSGTKVDKWQYFFEDGQLKQEGSFKGGVKHGLWDHFQADGKNALSMFFDNGEQLKVVEYDKFGKPKNDEDLIELNKIMSGQDTSGEETKAEKKARKKQEKEDAKKKAEKEKWGYEDKEKKD